MDAILYVCHGSRVQSAIHSAIHFVKKIQKLIDYKIQEISFIELAKPSIYEGLEACMRQGAKTISVLPVLLLSANHAKIDIPNEIATFQKKYPFIKINLANPIGVHNNMIELVKKRIFEKTCNIYYNSQILLVGRGSSDPLTQNDFSNIVQLLESSLKQKVIPAYMAVSKPSIHEAWEYLLSVNTNQTIVVPYLFFSGTLMSELKEKINTLPPKIQKNWILCDTLGYDPLIASIIKERILQLPLSQLLSSVN